MKHDIRHMETSSSHKEKVTHDVFKINNRQKSILICDSIKTICNSQSSILNSQLKKFSTLNFQLKKFSILHLLIALLFTSCQQETPMVSLGIDDVYYLPRMKAYALNPAFTGNEYRWVMQTASGKDSLLSIEKEYIFLAKDTGTYHLSFEIIDNKTPYKHDFRFVVMHEDIEYSPYISKVYEYLPAPGQFVNTMPEYEAGNTAENMRKKAEENISGTNDVMVSLGAYGGYITFGFDHTVINVEGEKDFRILANAFYSDLPEYKEKKGGSCEPGIVMVSFDTNQNGIPDDEWYELAGSEYYKPETIKGYEITYGKPDPNKEPVPDMNQQISDLTYIPWKDNQGETGYVAKNIYHTQHYYPGWISDDELRFQGTKLKGNGIDESGVGSYYVLYSYPWGYVDNHPNEYKDLNSFDIGWAIDKSGNKVHLQGIDFIKVYTAVNQYCGWIGETSTEIIRAQDLHIENGSSVIPDPLEDDLKKQYDNALNKLRTEK